MDFSGHGNELDMGAVMIDRIYVRPINSPFTSTKPIYIDIMVIGFWW